MDFTYFDGVLAPILIASTDWKVLYANHSVKRRFPFLTGENTLISRYDSADLEMAISSLENGEHHTLPYDDSLKLSLLFMPSYSWIATFDYIFIYVSCSKEATENLFPAMTDSELIHAMRRDLIPSLHFLIKQTKYGEDFLRAGEIEKAMLVYQTLRMKLIRQVLFSARVTELICDRKGDYSLCDASAVLTQISNVFEHVKYKPSEVCVVPVDRDFLVLTFTDVLSNLSLRQEDPKVRVSATSEEDGVLIQFVSGPLQIPLNVPCEDDLEGIDLGHFSVLRRMESVGGSVTVKRGVKGSATVILKFPYPRGILRNAPLKDSHSLYTSPLEEVALEYLSIISGKEAF